MRVKSRTGNGNHYPQFNLRKFLFGCVALGVLGGTAYCYTRDVVQTCLSVPRIERNGGVVYSDFHDRYGLLPPDRRHVWGAVVEWGMSTPDAIYFGLKQHKHPQRLLAEMTMLPRVRSIVLATPDITNHEIERLAEIRGLEEVRLSGTSIDDQALFHLTKLPQMKRLDISYTAVSDDALFHVMAMSALEELRVHDTNVTTTGLAFLRQNCPRLRIQPAPGRPLTDSLAQLGSF
jgi:hypothetical protein